MFDKARLLWMIMYPLEMLDKTTLRANVSLGYIGQRSVLMYPSVILDNVPRKYYDLPRVNLDNNPDRVPWDKRDSAPRQHNLSGEELDANDARALCSFLQQILTGCQS